MDRTGRRLARWARTGAALVLAVSLAAAPHGAAAGVDHTHAPADMRAHLSGTITAEFVVNSSLSRHTAYWTAQSWTKASVRETITVNGYALPMSPIPVQVRESYSYAHGTTEDTLKASTCGGKSHTYHIKTSVQDADAGTWTGKAYLTLLVEPHRSYLADVLYPVDSFPIMKRVTTSTEDDDPCKLASLTPEQNSSDTHPTPHLVDNLTSPSWIADSDITTPATVDVPPGESCAKTCLLTKGLTWKSPHSMSGTYGPEKGTAYYRITWTLKYHDPLWDMLAPLT